MSINVRTAAYAGGITGGILSVICAFLVYIAPAGTLNLFNSMMHGVDLTMIAKNNMTFGSFIAGLIAAIIIGAVIAGVYSAVYNKLTGR